MAQKYLGDYFDIHCGGEDHIPVHHTNEIAQTEARVGTRLANFWLHGYFLLSNDAKMAKSAGEFLRVAVADRARLRSARVSLPVPDRALSQRSSISRGTRSTPRPSALDRMRSGVYALPRRRRRSPMPAHVERFTNEINDDLNLPRALAVAWEVLRGDLADAR